MMLSRRIPLLTVVFLVLLTAVPIAVWARFSVETSDLNAESRALVERLVAERAAFIAAERRIAEERETKLLAELNDRESKLQREIRLRAGAEAELTAKQAELEEVREERLHLVDQLAEKDRQFAAEIAEYRRQIASIAASPDPRKREALELYAAGGRANRSAAFEALVEIQQIRGEVRREIRRAEDKADAAGWREIGALALDRLDRGEMTTVEVIPVYEEAQRLDSDDAWGWIALRRLYQEAGRLEDARRAAEEALARAENDRDRSVAASQLGDVELASGRLQAARQHFEQTHAILERLAEANPTSAQAQRDLSVSLNKLGDVEVAAGNLEAARQRFEQSRDIDQRLAEANPTSAEAQRDLSVSLNKLGDVEVAAGNLQAARQRFEQSRDIRERLAEANPTSAQAQRDLSVSLERLGSVEVAAGNLEAARQRFEQSRDIRERLAEANLTNAQAQRDLISAHTSLALLPGGEHHLRKALEIAEKLQREGRLAPRDVWMIDTLRQLVAAIEDPP